VQYVRYFVLPLIVTINAHVLSRSDTIDTPHCTFYSLLANVEKGEWVSRPMSVSLGVLQIMRTFFRVIFHTGFRWRIQQIRCDFRYFVFKHNISNCKLLLLKAR
jgi:hypothetical protein